ncbi:hypothetical protein Tco_1061742 [Tanacetum coccineum]
MSGTHIFAEDYRWGFFLIPTQIIYERVILPINSSFLDLLRTFPPAPNLQFALPYDDTFGTFDECNSQYREDNNESKSDVRDDSDDGSEVSPLSHPQRVMDFMYGVGEA